MASNAKDMLIAIPFKLLMASCRLLGLDRGSAMMGWLAQKVGPCLKPHRIARRNLQAAYSDWDEAKIRSVLRGVWDNLGRVGGELPFLQSKELSERIIVHGKERIAEVIENGKSGIFITAHLGNWEMAAKCIAEAGLPLVLVYRPANNPTVENAIRKHREGLHAGLYPKGEQGLRKVVKAMKEGKSLGMLVDQKYNEGIAVPFFGREAMTSPAVVKLAQKFKAPIIPVQVVRGEGVQFDVWLHEPLALPDTGNSTADTVTALQMINDVYESWIRQHPEQWFWVHQRWPR